ncbi:MAG: hypothetical protein EXQ84_03125 [Rhodospirillaceae bacterium]|nr:hypothetical protein [Rhodospirillaceae bacterium]
MDIFRNTAFALGAVLAAGFISGAAEAACTCVCVEGAPRAQCPSILETPPVCPLSVCATGGSTAKSPPIDLTDFLYQS